MLLKYKNDYSIKKKIIVTLIWSCVLYILVTRNYLEYINYIKSTQYLDLIIETFVILGFIGLIVKFKIARLVTLGIAYLVVYEFLISYFVKEFSEIFYISYPTLFFDLFILYVLNTKEVIELFNIKNPEKEKYYFFSFDNSYYEKYILQSGYLINQ